MAAPITHIVLTKKIFHNVLHNYDKKDFIIGTSFPDIRYLGTIDREKTHFNVNNLEDINDENPFFAGMKFHALVDKVREDFLLSRNIYSYCPESKYITQSIKFVEDKMLYEKIADWPVYQNYFDNILQEEIESDAGKDTVTQWHNLLKNYFANKPNEESIRNFVVKINLPESIAVEIINNVNLIEQIPEVISYIKDLYKDFEGLLNINK
jgi:hypothetical protein